MPEHTTKQKLDSIIEFNFNESTSAWDNKLVKDWYTYNSESNLIQHIYFTWDKENNQWENIFKEEFNYDLQGNITDYIYFVWINGRWNNDFKEDYTYNDKNELIEALGFSWKAHLNKWLVTDKWAYRYNDSGKHLKDSLYWWNDTSQKWKLKKKVDYLYINDKLHYRINSNWDSNTEKWSYSKKVWYLYDLEWLLYTKSEYTWVDSTEDWKLKTREGFGYDDDNYVKKHIILSRNLDKNDWNSLLSEYYTFDDTVTNNQLIIPYSKNEKANFYFHHKVISKKLGSTDFDTREEKQYREIKYYYSPHTISTGIKDVEQEMTMRIYPNPVKEEMTIDVQDKSSKATFKLFDGKGSIVLSTTLFGKKSINLSHLNSGVYIYMILLKDNIQTGKLIIE